MNKHAITAQPISPIPPDDLHRNLMLARPNEDQSLPHIALMGDTYTILLSGDDTDGRYCARGRFFSATPEVIDAPSFEIGWSGARGRSTDETFV